jgi:hypothetical protein
MQSNAATPDEYIKQAADDKREAISKLRDIVCKNLPQGFVEMMASGMINYCVSRSIYPAGYHVNSKHPLPFMAIACQKDFIAVYHMGLYSSPELHRWFTDEYPKYSKNKLDMGKSCLRFKRPDAIPYELIGELASKMTPAKWIEVYERVIKK